MEICAGFGMKFNWPQAHVQVQRLWLQEQVLDQASGEIYKKSKQVTLYLESLKKEPWTTNDDIEGRVLDEAAVMS